MTTTSTTITLAAHLTERLCTWAYSTGNGETCGLELLGIDEDTAVARFGEAVVDVLCAPIVADMETICTDGPLDDCPAQFIGVGSIEIDLPAGRRFGVLTSEDGPDFDPAEWFPGCDTVIV